MRALLLATFWLSRWIMRTWRYDIEASNNNNLRTAMSQNKKTAHTNVIISLTTCAQYMLMYIYTVCYKIYTFARNTTSAKSGAYHAVVT